jgi:ArsR family transcriptional regulator
MKVLMRVLKALSDPNRMRIVKILQHREACVCELTEALGITQPSVSRHVKILADADLVENRRDGLWIVYRLNRSPANPYAAAMLDKLQLWLEEDGELQDLIQKSAHLDRAEICKPKPTAEKRTSQDLRQ